MAPAGPPPVQRKESALSVPQTNYLIVVDTLKANNGAEAKAIRAMFGGNKQLMDTFLATCFNLLQSNPGILRDCTPASLVQAIKDAASLGLVPMSEDAAIVPYGDKATLLPMWRGYVKRIRRSREVADLDVQVVYMNDLFELELGTEPRLRHVPKLYGERDPQGELLDSRGGYRGVYAWAQMHTGKYIIEWMTEDDVNHVRDTWGNRRSRDGKPLPWDTSWPEMARKTVIRRLAKRLPAAAVDQLLELDKRGDEAAEEHLARVDDQLSEVRQLALRAVGALPEPQENTSTANVNARPSRTNADASPADENIGIQPAGQTGQEGPFPAATDNVPVLPPVDPDLDAAMRLAAEQEQLRRQRERRR